MSGPEEAAQYLQRTNFKTLIEWLTASSILHRPEDPVQFCSDLLLSKLEERAGLGFDPDQANGYAQHVYQQASTAADEHGRLSAERLQRAGPGAAAAAAGEEGDGGGGGKEGAEGGGGAGPKRHLSPKEKLEAKLAACQARLATAERLLEAARALAHQMDPVEATDALMEEAKAILGAEEAVLFVVPSPGAQVLRPADGKRYEVAFGEGLVGRVAETGETLNVLDAASDARYGAVADEQKGYTTRSALAGPVLDAEGRVQGVLEVDNRCGGGGFGPAAAAALGWLAALGAAALRNARLGREAERHAARLQALVDVVRTARASGTMGVNHLLFGLTRACPQIVGAEKCSVFVVDQKNRNLWSMQGDINFTIPMDKGIVGACATSGETINIPDAYADERFNQEVDKKEGYKTNSILCLPIKDENNVTSGVIQVINKLDGPFLPEDEDIMGLFLTIAAPLLNNSQLFESVSSGGIVQDPNKKKGKDQGSDDKSSPKSQSPKQETTGESPREVTRKRLESRQPTEIIMEGNEEGEEEGA